MSKRMSAFFILGTALVLFAGCSGSKVAGGKELVRLESYMEGHFNSTAQSKADSNFYDITLHMQRIWPEKKDAFYLYVEQAVTSMATKPYRQRVYRVSRVDKYNYLSEVYSLPEESKWINAWQEPAKFSALKFEDLIERTGCAVQLVPDNGYFYGATDGEGCESTLRGAKYATSEVEIRPDMILSWDRGYDAQGVQVWGSENGAYEFVKQ
jgi:CpeT protein